MKRILYFLLLISCSGFGQDMMGVHGSSKAASRRAEVTVLAAPTVSATNITPTSLRLVWNAVTNATSYDLYGSIGGVNFSLIYSGNALFFDDDAQPNDTYYYKITASANGYTTSPFSSTITVNIPAASTTPSAPVISANDVNNTLSATHSLGASEILISENNGAYEGYDASTINVGNVARAAGYWKFKTQAATNRNESAVSMSPAFTVGTGSGSVYVLGTTSKVSAGVYKNDGSDDILVKTIESGVTRAAGSYSYPAWDGLDDNGASAPSGNYLIKVVSNNVQYTWEGVVGNNSTNLTGNSVYNEWDHIHDMASAGNYVYTAAQYSEGPDSRPSQHKFHVNSPTTKLMVSGLPLIGNIAAETGTVCTDGNYVYWGALDSWIYNQNRTFVFATRCDNDAQVNFQFGQQFTTGGNTPYNSIINKVDPANNTSRFNKITGIAVQISGNLLFVARMNLNTLTVVNKSSGQVLNTFTYTAPRALACDANGKLWMVTGTNTITRYTANSTTGVLTSDGVTISGVGNPLSVKVSPSSDLVIVADGSSQQVKGYLNSTGAYQWTLGQLNGYLNSPAVANDKFMFKQMSREFYYEGTYVAFQPDGSFWVGDPGTKRNQHFSSSRAYINNIMFSQSSRSAGTDINNPNRVFSDHMEYSVSYGGTFGNSSWTPTYNWFGNLSLTYWAEYSMLRYVATLSNGRTYAMNWNRNTSNIELLELTTTGARPTGLHTDNRVKIASDGSLIRHNEGNPAIFKRKLPQGFDSNNNPIWQGGIGNWNPGNYTQTASVAWGDTDPIATFVTETIPQGDASAGGVVVSFDNRTPIYQNGSWVYSSKLYHLGGIRNNKWIWKTAKSTINVFNSNGTTNSYTGDYPTDGRYDNGNGTNNPGGFVLTIENSAFWQHHGEFWKNGQTNMWQHVDANTGLLLGVFGATRLDGSITDAPAKMAGNTLSGSIVKVGEDYYIYHCDESDHGGVHRWKVSGLNSIATQTKSITK
jgi:hypothetical protein